MDVLELQIHDNANQAANGLAKLTATLNSLKCATTNNAGLGKIATTLEKISTAATAANKVNLGGLSKQMNSIAAALAPLKDLGKNNLSSFVNSLKKVPDVVDQLKPEVINRFGSAVQHVADAVRPLANEMQKISMGFSAMPKRLQSFITQMDKSATSSYKAAHGYKAMAVSLNSLNFKAALAGIIYFGRRVVSMFSGMINSATSFIEDMNLVTVSLGQYGEGIANYAQRAQDLLGVDAAEFMRNTGTFMAIADGLSSKSSTVYKTGD